MFRKSALTLFALLGGLTLAACTAPAAPASPTPGAATMPNPASAYCERHAGQLDIRTEVSGGQYGVCVFPDHSECPEWDYYRGECQPGAATATPSANAGLANPASLYCERHAGQLDIRTEASGGQYGVCVFPDHSECPEWDYYRGECQPGAATP